ncbi:RidA family protein (plasmid) [Achromobacter xylosoxidans]|uniref:RidA family protein n=1 Tax=Alcaligenes xylosoxydans xylosoxydans TaxID=85698 RepID=UPI000DD15B36|nr:RidA family protein [Achromobacter xylosoxidans]AXA80571.1 RidA family protein [Achromobacter xylosoxidans]
MDDLTHAIESRLAAAGWRLPAPYHLAALDGATLACVSGQASRLDGVPIVGLCQPGQDLAPARAACAQAALSALAALRQACGGDLGQVRAILQLRGYLRSAVDFEEHSAVLDGASRVLEAAFPAMPRPARSAVGVTSLLGRAWVEIEIIAMLYSLT